MEAVHHLSSSGTGFPGANSAETTLYSSALGGSDYELISSGGISRSINKQVPSKADSAELNFTRRSNQTRELADSVLSPLIDRQERSFQAEGTPVPSQKSIQQKDRTRKSKDVAIDELTGVTKGNPLVATETNGTEPLAPAKSRAVGLPYPGRVLKYVPGAPLRFDAAAKQWQGRMRERGWSIQVDGFYGAQSAKICRQFQQEKGLSIDGMVGPQTWAAAFKANNLTVPNSGGAATGAINSKGLELVKKFEGLELQAYRDPVGIWTIGYGHTGPEVGPGDVISRAEAEALLKQDLSRFEKGVRSLVKVPLNTNQFSALVSFTYNVGTGALSQSTLLSLLNQSNYQGAANQFSRWVYGDGRVLPGLVRRRNEEKALFLTPT